MPPRRSRSTARCSAYERGRDDSAVPRTDRAMTLVGSEQAPRADLPTPCAGVQPTAPASGARRDWEMTVGLLVTDAVMIVAALYVSWVIRYRFEIGPEIEEP